MWTYKAYEMDLSQKAHVNFLYSFCPWYESMDESRTSIWSSTFKSFFTQTCSCALRLIYSIHCKLLITEKSKIVATRSLKFIEHICCDFDCKFLTIELHYYFFGQIKIWHLRIMLDTNNIMVTLFFFCFPFGGRHPHWARLNPDSCREVSHWRVKRFLTKVTPYPRLEPETSG